MDETYLQRLLEFAPKILDSFMETAIMMGFASTAAILIGLPLGTLVYLTGPHMKNEHKLLHQSLNIFINVVRSFPFLLLVVVMQPAIRAIYGRATGDPVAASFPLMLIAIALYARFIEQSLLDLPKGIHELAQSLGVSTYQYITKFLYVEARSSLIIGFTTAFVSFISYSTVMGIVGGGGIGDFAIRYGYQRYEEDIMYTAIVLIIIFVQVIQWLGLYIARRLDHR